LRVNVRKVFALLVLVILCVGSTVAQEVDCASNGVDVRMASAKSERSLKSANKQAGNTYRSRLVFAFKEFQFHSTSKAHANALLDLIPASATQHQTVVTLADAVCNGESLQDMEKLAKISEGFASALSKAVMLAPEHIDNYVAYALVATGDPHSDYAERMQRVCHHWHSRFLSAVSHLSSADRQQFEKHVMKSQSCTALAVPELE